MDKIKLPTLFHGTDAKIVRMEPEMRSKYKEDCILVLDYLYPFFEMNAIDMKIMIGDEKCTKFPMFWKAFCCIGGFKNGNTMYQYDNFYLTNIKSRAIDYAYSSFAGGELGMMAYVIYQAALKIGFKNWNPSTDVKSAAKRITNFAEQSPEPVLFSFEDIDVNYLKLENGDDLTSSRINSLIKGSVGRSYLYDREIKLDLSSAEILKPIPDFEKMIKVK